MPVFRFGRTKETFSGMGNLSPSQWTTYVNAPTMARVTQKARKALQEPEHSIAYQQATCEGNIVTAANAGRSCTHCSWMLPAVVRQTLRKRGFDVAQFQTEASYHVSWQGQSGVGYSECQCRQRHL